MEGRAEVKVWGGLSKLTRTVIHTVHEITEAGEAATFNSICNRLAHEFSVNGSRADLSRRIHRCCSRAVATGHLLRNGNSYTVTECGSTFICKTRRNKPANRSLPRLLLDDILAKKVIERQDLNLLLKSNG
jgi:hypothetical protein